MKSMRLRQWANRGLSTALAITIVVTYSMVSLAASSKPVGELSFSSGSGDSSVTVNGEAAKSGRTLFGDSTVSTPDGTQAIISLGKGTKVQLASNTTFALSADQALSAGSLMSGNLTVISSPTAVSVKNLAGDTVSLNAGESIEASAKSAAKQSGKIGGLEPWQLALIIGAAVAVVIIVVAASGGNDSTPVSPIR
jgi:hypothetical protein